MFSLSASHSYRMSVWRCHERIEVKHVIYYCDGRHYQSFKILCTVRSIYRSAHSGSTSKLDSKKNDCPRRWRERSAPRRSTSVNRQLHLDCPDAYRDGLLRQFDEMDCLGIVSGAEWRGLRNETDLAYLRAVAAEEYH
jgi:hypothetical protein